MTAGRKAAVVVAGAGPAGCACACALALRGIGPVVLVDKARFPRGKPCAGGLGPGTQRLLASIGAWEPASWGAATVTALKAVLPSGGDLVVRSGLAAHVVRRERFDAALARRAADLGVDVVQGTRVSSIARGAGGVFAGVGLEDGTAVEARWTVLATGAGTRLAPPAPGGRPGGRRLRAAIARYEGFDCARDTVEMYFDGEWRPLYGWVFPEGEGRANVGICYDWGRFPGVGVAEVYRRFVSLHLGERIRGARRVGPLSGSPIDATVAPSGVGFEGLLLAGEAGRLANAASGEGIRQALLSGLLAADCAADHLAGRTPTAAEAARRYERRVKARMGPGLLAGGLYRLLGRGVLDLAGILCRRGSRKVLAFDERVTRGA